MADDVQPPAGQGDAGAGIFDPYLQTVPEDGRDAVMAYLKDAEANVNSRLQEAAELRNTYAPYQEAGITGYDPKALAQLIEWNQQVTSSDDAWKEFVSTAAKDAGLTVAQTEALEQVEDTLDREKVAAMVSELADQRIAPLNEWVQQQEFTRAVEHENSLIVSRLDELQRENKIELTDEQKRVVLDLGNAAMPDDGQTMTAGHDWVTAGWERFQKLGGQAQKALVDNKLKQPKPALSAGGVAQVEQTNDWKTARERALETVRRSRST